MPFVQYTNLLNPLHFPKVRHYAATKLYNIYSTIFVLMHNWVSVAPPAAWAAVRIASSGGKGGADHLVDFRACRGVLPAV
jgi:hypothetical protein